MDGSRGGDLGFQIGMILATFYLQVAPILSITFLVNWPFGLKRRITKQIFKMAAMAFILNCRSKQFCAIFDLQVTLILPTKIGLSVQEKKFKIDFQHPGFLIGRILAIFDLQVTMTLPIKF